MARIILFLCMIILTSCFSLDLKSDIPEVVQDKFRTLYPKADVPVWEFENGRYEAFVIIEDIETSVIFLPDGTLYQTETRMDPDLLPPAARKYLMQNAAKTKIDESDKITKADGTILYIASVGKLVYLFDAGGEFIAVAEEDKDEPKLQ